MPAHATREKKCQRRESRKKMSERRRTVSEPVRKVPRKAVRCERVARRGVDCARERPVARGVERGGLCGAYAVPDSGLCRT